MLAKDAVAKMVRNSAVVHTHDGNPMIVINDMVINAKVADPAVPAVTFKDYKHQRHCTLTEAKSHGARLVGGACRSGGAWAIASPLTLLKIMATKKSFPLVRAAMDAVKKDSSMVEWLSSIDPALAEHGGRCIAPTNNHKNRQCGAPVVAGVEPKMCCAHRLLVRGPPST
jgi:hypothetical protein